MVVFVKETVMEFGFIVFAARDAIPPGDFGRLEGRGFESPFMPGCGGALRSLPDEAEGMACGVGVDAPAAGGVTGVENRGTESEDLLLGLVEVLDADVEVELLGAVGIRPLRRPMAVNALEGEHHAGLEVEGRPVVVERPPGIGPVDRATEERPVEPGELQGVRTVQHHALQVADHASSFHGWDGPPAMTAPDRRFVLPLPITQAGAAQGDRSRGTYRAGSS
jgi:hypothetical protein